MNPLQKILGRLEDAKQSGSGWIARCPAHEDRRASLSISEGMDGRALVHCHAGCEAEDVIEALGLVMSELWPDDSAERPAKPVAKSQSFATASEAVAVLEKWNGPRSTWWTYHDDARRPVGVIVRWDRPDGSKDIRPVARQGDRWIIGGMPEPRPLYGLPDLIAGGGRVLICEGEKSADAARGLGLLATASAHGAKSASKTDWSPLAGRDVMIMPDADDAGEQYAADVVGLLQRLNPRPTIRVVRLPGLSASGDISDWLTKRASCPSDDVRRELEALIDSTEPIRVAAGAVGDQLEYQPFPTELMPEPLRLLIEAGSKSMCCDPSYVAVPMLGVLAAAIGASRRIELKRGWTEPAILWVVVLGDSGTTKSPAIELATNPPKDRQRKAQHEAAKKLAAYEIELQRYDAEIKAWKQKGAKGDPPAKPEPPVAERTWTADATIEALAPVLADQPRGILIIRDELAAWFGGFDRYASSKGADVAAWLELHGGRAHTIDRKTGQRRINMSRSAVSVIGGIQPPVLCKSLAPSNRENGLAARLLMCWPPRRRKRWTDSDIDPQWTAAFAAVIDRLYGLQAGEDAYGDPVPGILRLDSDAQAAWIEFYNQHAAEHVELSGDLSAAWSKLEGYAARLALVMHLARWASGDDVDASVIDAASMRSGIALSRWFGNEARRIYAMMAEPDNEGQLRLIKKVRELGGRVTARELQRSPGRQFKKAEDAELALNELVAGGYGSWDVVQSGGRPARTFVLAECGRDVLVDTSPENGRTSVLVSSVNGENEAGTWGEL